MVQPLYSSANQVAQARAAGYLESTRLAGQGEELDVFFIVFLLKLRPNFCIDTWAVNKNNWLLLVVKGVIVILLLVADIVIANYR